MATVLSVIKPVLQIGKIIEKYTKLYVGHTNIFLELRSVVEEIDVDKCISKKVGERYQSIRRLDKELGGLEDPKPDEALIKKLQDLVNQEIPSESLWVP